MPSYCQQYYGLRASVVFHQCSGADTDWPFPTLHTTLRLIYLLESGQHIHNKVPLGTQSPTYERNSVIIRHCQNMLSKTSSSLQLTRCLQLLSLQHCSTFPHRVEDLLLFASRICLQKLVKRELWIMPCCSVPKYSQYAFASHLDTGGC